MDDFGQDAVRKGRYSQVARTPGTEAYRPITDNLFRDVRRFPLSTFGIDVDTASYANVRRFLRSGRLPPRDAVRIEELLNYFDYDYAAPDGDAPFSVDVAIVDCPWRPEHRLARIALKGVEFEQTERPPCNLVFLIDVSGSMQPADKLPLLKQAMRLLVDQLNEYDRVGIVVYANNARVVLPSTTANNRDTLMHAIDNLAASGSTNGGAGIQMAYDMAGENFVEGDVNRVILASDGDFNVGITDRNELKRLIAAEARRGVFLSVLGFGTGNLKDATLETLADRGDGHYAYIDDLDEARRVLVEQLQANLVTIARDVKVQIEFNPAVVGAHRLIGYENRVLAARDFNDDRKDAGDIGAGHTVTALYELVPVGRLPGIDALKYQPPTEPDARPVSDETLTLKLRYKLPDEDASRLMTFAILDPGASFAEAPRDVKFAAAVAGFGMILRDSPYRGNWTLQDVLAVGEDGLGEDRDTSRSEFIDLVRRAQALFGE
ncbi:MAG: VWA domain-containing protein [Phycisphaerae bacterium]